MKKYLFLFCITFPYFIYAQNDDKTDTNPDIRIKLGTGVMQYNLNSFNQVARVNNFPALKDGVMPQLSFGFILKDCVKNLFFDMNISTTLFSGERTSAYRLNMDATNFDFNVNYELINKDQHHIYPSLGFGFMGYSIDYTANRSGSFGQALQNPSGELRANTRMGIYINPGISYEYTISNKNNISIGAQAGYRIGLYKPGWRLNRNQKLDGAPNSDISGFYTTIYISL